MLRELWLALEIAGCVVIAPEARDPLRLRWRAGVGADVMAAAGAGGRGGGGGESSGSGGAVGGGYGFSATVMQPAPGALMISAVCDAGPKADGAAQTLFARAMVAARTRMLAPS